MLFRYINIVLCPPSTCFLIHKYVFIFLDKYIKMTLLVQSIFVCSVFINTAEQFSKVVFNNSVKMIVVPQFLNPWHCHPFKYYLSCSYIILFHCGLNLHFLDN